MQEQDFLIKLKYGDNRAFRMLVEAHKDRVYNTCLGFLRNVQDAEDTAQEVFIEVFNSIGSFNGESELGTWIYRITVNQCLELIRYRKRKKRFGFFKGLMSDEDVDAIENQGVFVHPGVELENKERAQILSDAMARLPEQQRAAFTLHKFEGLSYEEIAGILEKSLSAIESLMHRAKQHLQDDLYEYYKSEK